tara:strand:- start:219 stop:443 length:225 start_codon:yes stop_codon:yes gene_type:complete
MRGKISFKTKMLIGITSIAVLIYVSSQKREIVIKDDSNNKKDDSNNKKEKKLDVIDKDSGLPYFIQRIIMPKSN